MPYDRIVLAVLLVLGAVFVAVTLGMSWLLSPKNPTPQKAETCECGVEPIGPPWVQFHAGYYVYALLFVIFDIETVFLYMRVSGNVWSRLQQGLLVTLEPGTLVRCG